MTTSGFGPRRTVAPFAQEHTRSYGGRFALLTGASLTSLALAACGSSGSTGATATSAAGPASGSLGAAASGLGGLAAGQSSAAASSAAASAAGGASTSASGGTAAGGAGGGPAVTLTFVNAQDPGTFDKVIAGFQKANPNIKIKQQVVPFDNLNTTVTARLSSKDAGIDLFDVDEPRVASYAVRGYLSDLSDIGKAAQGKVDPKALQATTYQGKQVAMPRWTSTQVLFYNKTLLSKAGITPPSSDPTTPTTWEDIATNGKKAQTAGAKWGFTFDQVDRYYQLQPLPESLGAGPGLTGNGLLTPDITNAGWVKAFTWYADLFKNGISPRGVAAEQTPTLFSGGNVAYFAGGPWNAPAFTKAKVDYGVAAFPKFAGGKAVSSTGSWATAVSPFSKNQDAAKKFITYMTTDPTGAWEASSNNIPVQTQALQQYLTQMGSTGATGTQLAAIVKNELATNAVARPLTAGYVDFETVMNKAFADIRNGSDPAQRLQSATGELKRALAKYQQ